ncbi:MAG: TonB family protein [Planctomycetes bacterium]|nr:TonB family protein [Planctomycetota bacterium]
MAWSRTIVVSLVLHGVGIGLAVGAIGGLPGPRDRVQTTGFYQEQQHVLPAPPATMSVVEVHEEGVTSLPSSAVEVVPVFEDPAASTLLRDFALAAEPVPPKASLAPWRRVEVAPAPLVTARPLPADPASAVEPVTGPAARVLSVRPGTNRAPDYPLAARRRGCTGTVLLTVDVAADGAVVAVTVQRSCGHRVLDDAAVAALRRWSFDGGPGRIEVPIEFVLRG